MPTGKNGRSLRNQGRYLPQHTQTELERDSDSNLNIIYFTKPVNGKLRKNLGKKGYNLNLLPGLNEQFIQPAEAFQYFGFKIIKEFWIVIQVPFPNIG